MKKSDGIRLALMDKIERYVKHVRLDEDPQNPGLLICQALVQLLYQTEDCDTQVDQEVRYFLIDSRETKILFEEIDVVSYANMTVNIYTVKFKEEF